MNLSTFPNSSDNLNNQSEQVNKISVNQLIELCSNFKLTCVIKVISTFEQGFLFLKDGQLNNIKTESEINGEKAFTEILKWENTDNIIKKEIFPLKESVNIIADSKNQDLNIQIQSENKYMLFCQNIIKLDNQFLALVVCNLNNNKILGYDYNQNIFNLEVLLGFVEYEIEINNKIQSLKNTFSKYELNDDFQYFPNDNFITEYFVVNNFFNISKKLSNQLLISFIFSHEISTVFALKNLKKYSDELEKII